MEKEIKITPPEGFEIDKENSTFKCIKFKPIAKRWRDSKPTVDGYYLAGGCVYSSDNDTLRWSVHGDVFATKKQAKSALAMAQISQIMANDERFGGMVTDKEWYDNTVEKYVIIRKYNKIYLTDGILFYRFLAFHTVEQRDLFLEENEDLVKDYLMID